MEILSSINIPDIIPYFLAILGLLLIWQLHEIQAQAGRIDAMDFWVVSGIRLFVYATPCDSAACRGCRGTHGLAFLPSFVASRDFKQYIPTCENPIGCRCLLIGLYGAWPDAERLRKQLKWNRGKVQLTDEQLEALTAGGKNRRAGFTADRISLVLLEALQIEKNDPLLAINRYRFVVDEADVKRDLPFVVPSYLRLSDLLETVGQAEEAHEVVDNFMQRYTKKKARGHRVRRTERYRPSESQVVVMTTRRTRLAARTQADSSAAPA
jgi:hypothetical protein